MRIENEASVIVPYRKAVRPEGSKDQRNKYYKLSVAS